MKYWCRKSSAFPSDALILYKSCTSLRVILIAARLRAATFPRLVQLAGNAASDPHRRRCTPARVGVDGAHARHVQPASIRSPPLPTLVESRWSGKKAKMMRGWTRGTSRKSLALRHARCSRAGGGTLPRALLRHDIERSVNASPQRACRLAIATPTCR
ncbi:hypothetical protein NFJ02_11g05440 [Pycnococcus provasolii]